MKPSANLEQRVTELEEVTDDLEDEINELQWTNNEQSRRIEDLEEKVE